MANWVTSRQEGNIWVITIDREEKLNALNLAIIDALAAEVEAFEKNPDVRVAILQSKGEKAFVAGADIKEFAEFAPDEGYRMALQGHQKLFARIDQCTKPIIALVQGYALGGGLELAMSCTFRIASEHAQFGLPELSLGLIPGYGGTQRLTALVGAARAKELILFGKRIPANTALQWGLVHHVVSFDKLESTGMQWAAQLASQSPQAMQYALQAIHAAEDPQQDGYEVEQKLFGASFQTKDFQEGVKAFIEKRKPKF
jgi:enoyl-CoA hydratase